jgi:hypothetical protein
MLTREVLNAALALIGEPALTAGDEYEERAPYILAAFCTEVAIPDRMYRRANGLEEREPYAGIYLGLEEEFPASAPFVSAAATYLAALLLLEDDPDASEVQFARYCDRMATIVTEMPGRIEPVKEVY